MRPSRGFDLIVVGAGPGGSMAALHAARGGRRVLLLDRLPRVGVPVRCGEAVGVQALAECTEVDPAWIGATVTNGVRMVSPSGIPVDIERMAQGYMVRRDLMDAALVERARAAGAQVRLATPIVGVQRDGDGYVCRAESGEAFSGRCVVLADGVESRLARQLGWDTTLAMQDVCSCAFGRAAHASVPIDRIELHYGSNVAPGGYGWVFPRGDGSANIGLGVLGSRSRAGLATECLQVFARRRFPGATLTHVHCGGVPVAPWTRPLVRGGAMLVGDAARQVDALSGGGINFAMMAGKLAGTAAAAACAGASFQERELQAYERAWRKGPGRTLSRVYALKQMVIGLSDATLDDIACRLTGRKMGGMSLVSVCFGAFARRPLLLLKALMVYR